MLRWLAAVSLGLLVNACYTVQQGNIIVFMMEPGKYVPVLHYKLQPVTPSLSEQETGAAMSFTMKCQPCGALVEVSAPDPRCAMELAAAALAAGWIVHQNNIAEGIVIFCGAECRNAALTKSGFFRRDLGRGRNRRDNGQTRGPCDK